MTVKFARWVLTQLLVWVQPASTGAQRGYSEKTAWLMVVLGAAFPMRLQSRIRRRTWRAVGNRGRNRVGQTLVTRNARNTGAGTTCPLPALAAKT